MNLIIHINSGKRKGTKIYLDVYSKLDTLEYVLEDEEVIFEYTLPNNLLANGYQNVKLHLHEVVFDPTDIQVTPEGKKFKWFSEAPYQRRELFFRNYCGIAELSVEISGFNIEPKSITFNHIDILASKLSSDRITAMLDYLSQNDAKDIAALARITKRESGLKQDKVLLTSLIDKLSSYLLLIKQVIPKIINKPITKVQPISRVLPFNKDLHLNHSSIIWLSANIDELQECSKDDNFDIELDEKYYKINKILVNDFIENTDIYENQVIYGFISILIRKIDSIVNEYNSKFSKNAKTHEIDDYFSLFSRISKFQKEISKNLIKKCELLKIELIEINKTITEKIPVSKAITTTPYFTLKVKNNHYYKTIFQKMIEIKNLGSPDWSLQDELNSIRDIPKLFEYYCLLLTKRSVEVNLKYKESFSNNHIFNENINDFCFSYSISDVTLDIFYEPKIWGDKNIDSVIPNLINPEAWKVDRNKIKQRNNIFNGTMSHHRCPDIIIRLKNLNSEKYIIIDAKYTNSFLSWNTYLPQLAMKYIHGITNKSGDNSTLALIVLNPDEKGFTRHYLDEEYSIYGNNTVYPSLFNSILDINKSNELENNYVKDIKQVLSKFID